MGDVPDVESSAREMARGCTAMARAYVATAMALKQSRRREVKNCDAQVMLRGVERRRS
jgi:hypothetical protein